jgi:hypothetical protein
MTTPNFPLPPWLQKIQDGFEYGLAWLRYYGRLLDYCLLTPEGRAQVAQWPWLVWITLLAAVLLIFFIGSRIANPSPRYRGRYIRGTRLVAMRGYWWKVLIWSSKALVIGKVRWPKKLEPLHLLAMGAPGTGKSQRWTGRCSLNALIYTCADE